MQDGPVSVERDDVEVGQLPFQLSGGLKKRQVDLQFACARLEGIPRGEMTGGRASFLVDRGATVEVDPLGRILAGPVD